MTVELEPGIRFHREKLLSAIEYIVHLRKDDLDSLGRTKLHKCLYYSDMLYFVDTGAPITGVDYIKKPFGPTARYLPWALGELEKSGAISVNRRSYFGLQKDDFESLRDYNSNILSQQELGFLGAITGFVCEFKATEISEISHSQPWRSVQMGERIPYATAFLLLPQPFPTDADIRHVEEIARKRA